MEAIHCGSLTTWEQIGVELEAVARGEDGAWERLIVALTPELETFARRAPIGRLRYDEDARRDIIAGTIARLHRDDHAAIRRMLAQPERPPLIAWFRLIVRRVAIDVLRGRPEFVRAARERDAGWLSISTLVSRHGAASPASLEAKRREVVRFLAEAVEEVRAAIARHGDGAADALATAWGVPVLHARRIVKRADDYVAVLAGVFAGHTHVELADQLGRTVREIELVLDYLEELFHVRGFAA